MASIDDNQPLPGSDEILAEANQPEAPAPEPTTAADAPATTGVEQLVPFAADDDRVADWDDLYVEPQKTANVKPVEKRKPVRAYQPTILKQNTFVETPKDLVPTDKLRDVILNLAQTTPEDLKNVLDSLDPDEMEGGPELYEWLMKLNDGTVNQQDGDVHLRALGREGSAWRQRLQGQRHFIAPAYKKLDLEHISPNMSGADAVDLFLQGTGIGRSVRWPLYRTGIWINIRPASLTYLSEIDRSLSFERAQLGMDTSGLINSNDSLIFDEKLTDAALRLITWTNVDVASPMDLKSLIVTQDIPSLIMAMAAATFADGFSTNITCTDNKCRNDNAFDSDLRRMSWVDSARFSQKQLEFMDQVDGEKHTIAQVREYQAEFDKYEEGHFEYKGRVFEFGVGSIDYVFALGHSWINQINLAMNEAIQDQDADPVRRARILQSILTSEMLCRYGHYIKAIRIPKTDGEGNEVMVRIEDRGSITNILRHLMSDDDGATGLIKSIQDYIAQIEVVVHGYRNMRCAKCGNYHLDDQGEARIVIPIKVGATFFTLLQQRLMLSGIQPITDLETSGMHASVQQVLENESRRLSILAQQAQQSMLPSSSEMPTT